MSASPTILPKPRNNNTVVRKSTRKSSSIQTAITARRMNGQSKRQIARAEGIAVNTVTSILELNDVESQIAKARQDAVALAPLAIAAVQQQIEKGDGDLGYKVLTGIGAIGEDAIDTIRRNSRRQSSAINVLVQPGATVNVHSNANVNDNTNTVTVQANNSIVTDDKNDNANVSETGKGLAPGKQPKTGPRR